MTPRDLPEMALLGRQDVHGHQRMAGTATGGSVKTRQLIVALPPMGGRSLSPLSDLGGLVSALTHGEYLQGLSDIPG